MEHAGKGQKKGFGLRTFWKHTPSQSDAEVTMIIQEPSLGQECTVEELELAQSPNLCKRRTNLSQFILELTAAG